MTDLEALVRLCPPPNPAMYIDWNGIEATLGMPLPDDYKALADRYGPGYFSDYLTLYHPHGPTEYVNLIGPMPARIRAQLRTDYDRGTHPVPYDPDHLFACGVTGNGEYLFWITDPVTDSSRWRIAVNEARGPRWFTYDGTVTSFLLSVLTGETHVPQFPHSLLDVPPTFTPSHPVLLKPQPYDRLASAPVDTAAVRAWARENGYDVPSRGRVPPEILRAWDNAQSR
ncbi:histone-like nucleoid-structuring protein Lsr2 [Streptomyces sp. NPDC006645]|uniref:Lsr2 family DNA-binding protein n=1 Tax=unclassified Streptomyces TaxID=2593676 RepID=UPI0033B2A358